MTSAPASTGSARNLQRRILRAFVDIRELTPIVLIVLIVIVMANLNQFFLSFSNFRALPVGMAPTAVIVTGISG